MQEEISYWSQEERQESGLYYVIEKYEEKKGGALERTYVYITFDGEIIYFEEEDSDLGSEVYCCYADLNIPAPFRPGDIIVVDGRLTCEQKATVLLRGGDNWDCCSHVAMFVNQGNILRRRMKCWRIFPFCQKILHMKSV